MTSVISELRTNTPHIGFEVLTAASMKMAAHNEARENVHTFMNWNLKSVFRYL
jgi:hypothetical protein